MLDAYFTDFNCNFEISTSTFLFRLSQNETPLKMIFFRTGTAAGSRS